MKAIVWHDIGDIRLEEVPDPKIQAPTDAIVKLTASAICGTDLHMVRGTMTGMKKGTILGHEGVGIVEQLGPDIRNLSIGDRVLIPSTIACGYCSYCRDGYYSQCDYANPNGPAAGTAFFGGPELSGPYQGLQAEKARIPYAQVNLIKLPSDVTDEQAILLSDIFPTAYFGADLAEIEPGKTVAIFGCGPVGLFAVVSARLIGAGRIFAIDCIPSRLEAAKRQGAEVINFHQEDPVTTIKRLTGGIGVDRVIDAVGVDATSPLQDAQAKQQKEEYKQELQKIAPTQKPQQDNWIPGNAPSQVCQWAVQSLAKAGILSIIGVYPETDSFFPIGAAMSKNLTIRMGNCPHRKYIPLLLELVQSGTVDPSNILSNIQPIEEGIKAYQAFDKREEGWIKVELQPNLSPVTT